MSDAERGEADIPPDSKLTTTKQRWADQRKFITGTPVRPESARLPPGQHLVRDWPVLDLGAQPNIDVGRWRLQVGGAVENPVTLDWAGFQSLPRREITSDIHCVTTWSRYDNRWDGVPTGELLELVRPTAAASHVMLQSSDGYTTNLPLADFAAPEAILATGWEGKPLTREHGGPMRLVVPHLYFWKSAKWLRRVEFMIADRLGFWEERGYHMRGDPWAEERYSD